MTRHKNRRNIRWGLYSFFAAIAWAAMQPAILDGAGYGIRMFSGIVMTGLVFGTFFLLLVFGLAPRYVAFLQKSDTLTDEQLEGLSILPTIED